MSAHGDAVGSAGEEAAKLLGALADWTRDHRPGGTAGAPGGGGVADGSVADGAGADCAWCPVCRVAHAVRQSSPEVREHLVEAASALLQAATGFLAALKEPPGAAPESRGAPGGAGGATAAGGAAGGPTGGLQRIDLDDGDEAEGRGR